MSVTGDDYGYMIKKEKNNNSIFNKKPVKITLFLLSIMIFVLITISAKYFSKTGESNRIKIIKAADREIKIRINDSDIKIKNIDKSIYDNIVSGENNAAQEDVTIIKNSKTAKIDKEFLNESTKIKKIDQSRKNLIVDSIVNDEDEVLEYKNISEIDNFKKSKKRYSRVQLIALKSSKLAYDYWIKMSKNYPSLFLNLKYYIQTANLGNRGTFYRLQIGDFKNQNDAEEFCLQFIATAKKKKSDCIIVE